LTAQTPKIRSKWWYLLPIFLGVIGGVIAWVAIKSHDRKLAKNCLILGISLVVIEIMIVTGLIVSSDVLNLVTEFESISKTSDFDIQFKINAP
jgi:4-amino-4-deoxy-L-arabinose transferase-like glycosyltransferase